MNKQSIAAAIAVTLSCGISSAYAWPSSASWPGGSAGPVLGSSGSAGIEPSGIAWDPYHNFLWAVGDEGKVLRINANGSLYGSVQDIRSAMSGYGVSNPSPESVTVNTSSVSGKQGLVYFGQEYPAQIFEYSTSSWGLSGKRWKLSGMTLTSASGMEGLTFVPNGAHAYGVTGNQGGIFLAGSQYDGKIYVYNPTDAQSGGTVAPLTQFTMQVDSGTDCADLYYSPSNQRLYVLIGRKIIVLASDASSASRWREEARYSIPSGTNQEGISFVGTCSGGRATMAIAEDDGASGPGKIVPYGNFPCTGTSGSTTNLVSYLPDADGYTKSTAASSAFGSGSIEVDNYDTSTARSETKVAFLKFTVNVPQAIQSAKLKVYVANDSSSAPALCKGASTSWTESNLTYANMPACANGLRGDPDLDNPALGQYLTYDVTNLVGANGTYTFRLDPMSSDGIDFPDRANSDTGKRPILEISY